MSCCDNPAAAVDMLGAATEEGEGRPVAAAGEMQQEKFEVGHRVWYKSSSGEEIKARVVRCIDGQALLDLNVREEADIGRVRPRLEADASDDDEYDYLEDDDDDSDVDSDDDDDDDDDADDADEEDQQAEEKTKMMGRFL